jgi:aspartate/methionine/tyrosine aminotransferase
MHALLGPDDHALVCYPNYQSAETVPLGICETTGIRLDPDQNWTLDLDDVRANLRPNTRVISINFPNNPTGKILERDKFDALVELCRERGIVLFSDEVYRLIERDPGKRLPQAADIYERALSLNVMSKAYGMAGLRIGWIASQDRPLLVAMERIKHYLSICNSAPSEVLATIALKARDKILERNRALVENNVKLLTDFFGQFPDLFDWTVPDGGCVGFPRYKGPEGVEEFTSQLVEESGVILLPASVYRSDLGPVPADRFRIGYGRTFLPEALDILKEHLTRRRR